MRTCEIGKVVFVGVDGSSMWHSAFQTLENCKPDSSSLFPTGMSALHAFPTTEGRKKYLLNGKSRVVLLAVECSCSGMFLLLRKTASSE